MKRGLLMVLMLLFIVQSVNAVGISPSRIVVDYSPGGIVEHKLTIINNMDEYAKVELFVTGELKDSIKIDKLEFYMYANDAKEVPVKIFLPTKLDEPGNHKAVIRALAVPKSAKEGIMVVGSVETFVIVQVPYDKPFLDLELSSRDVNAGDSLPVTLKASNLGEGKIDQLKIGFELSDLDEQVLDKKELPTVALEGLNDFKRTVNFGTDGLEAGIYRVTGLARYDADVASSTIDVRIGDLFVDVLGHDRYITKGGIRKFSFNVTNMWSSIMGDVYADVILLKNNREVYSVKTPSVNLEPWRVFDMEAFIDTDKLEVGGYDLRIVMHYNRQLSSFEGVVGVLEPKIGKGDILLYAVAALFIVVVLMEFRWLKSKD